MCELQRSELVKMRFDGYSAREIGEMVGLTRNAVLGRIYREMQMQNKQRNQSEGNELSAKTPRVANKLCYGMTSWREDGVGTGWRSKCQWPIGRDEDGNYMFCNGKTIPEKPYCTEHHEIAYVKRSNNN